MRLFSRNFSSLFSPAATEGRLEGEVDVLLRIETDDEWRDVDNLREHRVILLSLSWCVTLAEAGDNYVMIHDSELSWSLPWSSYLLPHADVSLLDENPGVVDRLGKPQLEHLKRIIQWTNITRRSIFGSVCPIEQKRRRLTALDKFDTNERTNRRT